MLTSALDLILPLSPPLPDDTAMIVRHTRIGGDGQTRDGEPLPPYATFLAGDTGNSDEVQIHGPESPIDLSSDWQGRDGAPSPGLWDTQTDELWLPLTPIDPNNYSLRWVALTEPGPIEQDSGSTPLKATVPIPPGEDPPEPQLYDCVYVTAIVMTTTG